MIKIIVSTNRINATSGKIAQIYQNILKDLGEESEIINLVDLPDDFVFSALYEKKGRNEEYNIIHEQVKAGEKFVFVVPEYNGSFPGILKSFIDGMTYPNSFFNKKCALVGISSGIGGGGIAMSHLTDIFHYLGMHVLRSEEHTSELQSRPHLVCRLLLEKKKKKKYT